MQRASGGQGIIVMFKLSIHSWPMRGACWPAGGGLRAASGRRRPVLVLGDEQDGGVGLDEVHRVHACKAKTGGGQAGRTGDQAGRIRQGRTGDRSHPAMPPLLKAQRAARCGWQVVWTPGRHSEGRSIWCTAWSRMLHFFKAHGCCTQGGAAVAPAEVECGSRPGTRHRAAGTRGSGGATGAAQCTCHSIWQALPWLAVGSLEPHPRCLPG